MQSPKVSIIVPCYNQAQFLPEALESVFQQTYAHWECIIVNDGSKDTTETVAQEWAKKDERFRCITITNGGLANARNVGIENATGMYVLPLDADDRIAPDYVTLAIHAFIENPSLKVVYCNAEKFGALHGPWQLQPFSIEKLAYINMIFCSAVFLKEDWKRVGGYDVAMKYGWEDWEFWISLLKDGGAVKQLDYVGFNYRITEKSMLQQMDAAKKTRMFNYMSLKHTQFYITHIGNFQELASQQYIQEKRYKNLLKSKKHAVNVLCYSFLKWKPFSLDTDKKNNG